MNTRDLSLQSGFTLIELILTLVLSGLAATMVLPLFQSGAADSATPIFRLESLAQLEATMANINAAVREPSTTASAQNPYQIRGEDGPESGGMQTLKKALEKGEIFQKWQPEGASITATTVGPFKLGLQAAPSQITDGYDQNYSLLVILKNTDGATLAHLFCEGSNYQTAPEDGWEESES